MFILFTISLEKMEKNNLFFAPKKNKQMKGENSNAFVHNLMQIFFHCETDGLLILLLQKKTEYKVQL